MRELGQQKKKDKNLMDSQRQEIGRLKAMEGESAELSRRLAKAHGDAKSREKVMESLRREVGRLREMEVAYEKLWGQASEDERTSNLLKVEVSTVGGRGVGIVIASGCWIYLWTCGVCAGEAGHGGESGVVV